MFFSVFAFVNGFSQDTGGFIPKWSNGYKLESADKMFKMKFGGRIMWDNAFFIQDDSLDTHFGTLTSGSEFRRIRFFNSGTIYNNIAYKLQFDFAGGKVAVKDAFVTIKGIPGVGNIQMGHFKEPIRLESLTSSKYIPFMERSFNDDLLESRNSGIMLYNDLFDSRLSWQAGLFRGANSAGDDKNAGQGYAVTARVTGLPFIKEEKNQMLHLGAAFSMRNPNSDEYETESRPEAHLGHKYVSTGTIARVDKINMFNVEAALVMNALSFQGEYMMASMDTLGAGSALYSFNSYYVQAGYFLTGESRPYKSSLAGFSRVKPNKNFGNGEGGPGAWEIALRYSSVNLNSSDVAGGEQTAITAGLNWYLNPATRLMANYVLAQVAGEGDVSVFQFRVQLDF